MLFLITFDQLVYANVCMITSLPTKRISAISQRKTFIVVLPTRWRRKPASSEITSLSRYVLLGVRVATRSWNDFRADVDRGARTSASADRAHCQTRAVEGRIQTDWNQFAIDDRIATTPHCTPPACPASSLCSTALQLAAA